MAFGQPTGPPASHRQIQELLELLEAAGHSDFRDARGPMGFTQRQAGGKFTRDEADAFIATLQEAEHQAEHDRFTADMRYTRDRYFSGGEAGLGPHLLAFLKDWLNNHILVEDMAYRPFLEGNAQVELAALRFGPGLADPDPSPAPPRPAGA